MAYSVGSVNELKIEVSGVSQRTINASWKYSKSNKGDFKYFKNFKVTWTWEYKDNKKTIPNVSTGTQDRRPGSESNIAQFTLPQIDITKIKSITVYCQVVPELDQKDVTIKDKKGNDKTKKETIGTKSKKSNVLTLNTGELETVQVPPVPSVEILSNDKIKCTIRGYTYESSAARSVRLQVRKNGKITEKTKDDAKELAYDMTGRTSTGNYSWQSQNAMSPGNYYQYRVKGYNHNGLEGNSSKWSDWTDAVYAKPKIPKGEIYAQNAVQADGSLLANFVIKDEANNKVDMISEYWIQYSTDPNDLKYNRAPNIRTIKGSEKGAILRQETGHVYCRIYDSDIMQLSGNVYFRVIAVGNGNPTQYSDKVTDTSKFYVYNSGSDPLPPTVWSEKSSYVDDEDLILNWTNNSTDGSFATKYQLKFTLMGNTYDDSAQNKNRYIEKEIEAKTEPSYTVNLGTIDSFIQTFFPDKGIDRNYGLYKIQYSMRVMGAFSGYDPGSRPGEPSASFDGWSDWTTFKQFEVYRKPWLQFENNTDDEWLWDPFDFRYDSIYTAYRGGEFPNEITSFPIFIGVNSGPDPQVGLEYQFQIYSTTEYDILDYDGSTKHVVAGELIWSTFSPPTKAFFEDENDANHCLVRINPWDISLKNGETYRLVCTVTMSSGLTATLEKTFGTSFEDVDFMPAGDIVMDSELYSCYIVPKLDDSMEYEPGEIPLSLDEVVFHIFRRNYDGTMTEVASAINGDIEVSVTDPHPALNGASYRIVAMSKRTGEIQYVDIPGPEFDKKAIIIQWDGETQDYDLLEDWSDETPDPDNRMFYGTGISNNMVVLPYNIDATNQYNMDVELVDYIGREHPVSYYGTQKGESLELSTLIPKSSKDIIYQLRRLSIYAGDCYIREPNGTGFWANVTVNFNINHLEVSVPVSITATRVEGGL